MSLHIPPSSTTDVVFIDTLRVSANIGPDCWGKKREQHIHISVYLHLKKGFLDDAGRSDDVGDSVHYGYLTKAVAGLVKEGAGAFEGVDGLVEAVATEAFGLVEDDTDDNGADDVEEDNADEGEDEADWKIIEEVRVVVQAPKLVLLAKNFLVDALVSSTTRKIQAKKVTVAEWVIPVLIGVNPPEREAKQRVVLDLVFYEKEGVRVSHVEYQKVVDKLSKEIEVSEYLTLEKLVQEVARSACLELEGVEAITVRAKKPSALSFADHSGVEITRRRAEFLDDQLKP